MKSTAKKKAGTNVVPFKEPEPQNVLQTLRMAALDKRVDPAKMREIAMLAIDLEKHANEKAFDLAMTAVQSEIKPILKDKQNPSTGSKYLPLERLSRIIDPIIHRHGFSLSFGMAESHLAGHYRVTCRVSCAGHTRLEFYDAPTDTTGPKGNTNKTAIQGSGSAVSYARRYLKGMIFDVNLVNEDDDGNYGNAEPPKLIDKVQYERLMAKLDSTKADKIAFCAHYGVDAVANLPATKFDEAMRLLKQKADKAVKQ